LLEHLGASQAAKADQTASQMVPLYSQLEAPLAGFLGGNQSPLTTPTDPNAPKVPKVSGQFF
jgi:hypothetical protein